ERIRRRSASARRAAAGAVRPGVSRGAEHAPARCQRRAAATGRPARSRRLGRHPRRRPAAALGRRERDGGRGARAAPRAERRRAPGPYGRSARGPALVPRGPRPGPRAARRGRRGRPTRL
ncbi:MAG: hypothetical protein AVDCRST_MAG79-2561, partial [uncultured Thermoleophilia bacterium]